MPDLVLSTPTKRRVAVFGAASPLGDGLVASLERSAEVGRVVAVDAARPSSSGDKTRFYALDLAREHAEERIAELLSAEAIDTMVHLALQPAPKRPDLVGDSLDMRVTELLLRTARRAPLLDQLVCWSDTLLYGAAADNPVGLTEDRALAAPLAEPFFTARVGTETALSELAQERPDLHVATLRMAPILGLGFDGYLGRYLAQRVRVTLLGFDPVWQLLHQVDAVAALLLAVERRARGAFNIVAQGVLPLSRVMRAVGGSLRLPSPVARRAMATLWTTRLSAWPPEFLPYLRHGCIADGGRAERELGFVAACNSEEALADFVRGRA